MAFHAPITGAPSCVPASSPSRRGMLGALTAASLFAASGAARVNSSAVAGAEEMNMMTAIAAHRPLSRGRAKWDRAMAAFEEAKREYAHHDETVYRPMDAEVDRIAPRPDLHFDVAAKNGQVARFHVWPAKLHEWDDHPSPVFREKAAAVRKSWLAHLAAQESTGWNAASTEDERLLTVKNDRERDLILLPSPDLAALRWKLETLFGDAAREPDGDGPSWCGKFIDAFMADATRLLADA